MGLLDRVGGRVAGALRSGAAALEHNAGQAATRNRFIESGTTVSRPPVGRGLQISSRAQLVKTFNEGNPRPVAQAKGSIAAQVQAARMHAMPLDPKGASGNTGNNNRLEGDILTNMKKQAAFGKAVASDPKYDDSTRAKFKAYSEAHDDLAKNFNNVERPEQQKKLAAVLKAANDVKADPTAYAIYDKYTGDHTTDHPGNNPVSDAASVINEGTEVSMANMIGMTTLTIVNNSLMNSVNIGCEAATQSNAAVNQEQKSLQDATGKMLDKGSSWSA